MYRLMSLMWTLNLCNMFSIKFFLHFLLRPPVVPLRPTRGLSTSLNASLFL